jgi:hypothetical protein
MNSDETPAANATSVAQQILAESAARTRAAGQEAYEAQAAFAAGKFPEYIQAKYEAAIQPVMEEYRNVIDGADSA